MADYSSILQAIDEVIDSSFEHAAEHGVWDFAKRVPRQRLRCFILTSSAFEFERTAEQASEILGISVNRVNRHLAEMHKNENIQSFRELWTRTLRPGSFDHPLSFEEAHDEYVTRVF
jgi:hypothetical protein